MRSSDKREVVLLLVALSWLIPILLIKIVLELVK